MSVDVSPDGRTLVFDLLGDLYTLPIGGGSAARITSGQAFDAMPRFSPDGKRIAFVSDRSGAPNLWVADADGTHPRQLSRTEGFGYDYLSPTWTPDGNAVVVSHNIGPAATGLTLRGFTPFDLYLYPLAGGVGQRLTGGDAGGAGGAGRGGAGGAPTYLGARFAGPQTIWYSTGGQGAQLFTLDVATGKSIRRTVPRGIGMRPIPSPDGQWLVYATRRNDETALRLRELATGDERWLVRNAQRDQIGTKSTRDLMPGMAFTPDSKALVTSYGGKLWRVAVPSGEATAIPFTADVDQMIGATTQFAWPINDSTLTVRQIRVPKISPDGKRVAFVALDRVWVADLPAVRVPGQTVGATNIRRLTRFDVSEYSPAWTPDGQSVAFVTWDDSTGGEIYRVRVGAPGTTAAAPQKLSKAKAFYEKLAYTPDGTKLLFARASRAERFEGDELGFAEPSSTHADLLWMPAAGGTATPVTRLEYLSRLDPPYYGVPHFGPDSSRVMLFDANANGLYAMRLDGSDRQLIARAGQRPWNSSGEEPVDDLILSPKGGYAAILGGQNMWLATMTTGATAPTISLMRPTASPVPLKRLTKIGAQFAGWSADGRVLHYALGSALFLYDIATADSMERAPANPEQPAAYEPTRVDITITVPKDRPSGTVVLRGARVVTMKGTEVIENADVVVRNNRIAAVGARGQVNAPADARIVDVSGKTIVPGYVDTHAHMYAPGWGLHRTELWQYYANLAYGVTSDARSADRELRRHRLQRSRGDRRRPRPAHLHDGEGLLRERRDPVTGRRAQRPASQLGLLQDRDDQGVRGGRPTAASARRAGGAGAQALADERGRCRLHARPHAHARRLRGRGAHAADVPALQGRRAARGAERYHVHAGVDDRVRRPARAGIFHESLRYPRREEGAALLAADLSRISARAARSGIRTISTRSRSSRPRRRRLPRRAGAWPSGRMATCRASATTSRCGASRWAACPHTRCFGRRRWSARRRSGMRRTLARSKPGSSRTCRCSTRIRWRTSATRTRCGS